MNWFKHDSSARNDVKLKLLKNKFGAEGYGIYFQLLEIISENIKEQNPQDWGKVESVHSMDTLAIECGVGSDLLRKVVRYCDEIGLLQRIDKTLAAPKILRRLGESMQRKARETNLDLEKLETDLLRTYSEPARDKEEKRREEKRTEAKPDLLTLEYQEWLTAYNTEYKTSYKTKALLANYSYWRNQYSQVELLGIISKLRNHEWLKDKHKPELVLRQRDTNGNPVDRIGELLSLKDKRRFA
jgi:hypothetical protein